MLVKALGHLRGPTGKRGRRTAMMAVPRYFGGDGGIRTLGAELSARRFSKPLVSATHPRLRIAAARDAYSGGHLRRQEGLRRDKLALPPRPDANLTRFVAWALQGGGWWIFKWARLLSVGRMTRLTIAEES